MTLYILVQSINIQHYAIMAKINYIAYNSFLHVQDINAYLSCCKTNWFAEDVFLSGILLFIFSDNILMITVVRW